MHCRDPAKKRRWEKWLEKQDPFTQSEIERRDRFLQHISFWLHRRGCTANRITVAGGILTAIWFLSYSVFGVDRFLLHTAFVVIIALTDIFDGSVARNNDNVTLRGIIGDHVRDLAFALYTGWVGLGHGFPLAIYLLCIAVEVLILYFKWRSFLWYSQGLYSRQKFFEFAEDNFQHTVSDRYHAISYFVGLLCFAVSQTYALVFLRDAGLVIFGISIAFGALTIYKEFTWTPVEENK